MNTPKTAFIAIVGKANVGKSSILNKLLGTKIAIVSSKPQTTRTRIMGVLTTDDNIQLVFTDTPGFHKPKTKLGEKMIKAVDDSIGGVDSCLFVTECRGEVRPTELELLKKYDNYYIDLSGYGVFRQHMLRYGIDKVGVEKFIFGSDYPTCSLPMNLGAVLLDTSITDTEKEFILSKNAKRILGL